MVVVVQFLSLESLSWPTTNIEYGQFLPTQIIFGIDFICRSSSSWGPIYLQAILYTLLVHPFLVVEMSNVAYCGHNRPLQSCLQHWIGVRIYCQSSVTLQAVNWLSAIFAYLWLLSVLIRWVWRSLDSHESCIWSGTVKCLQEVQYRGSGIHMFFSRTSTCVQLWYLFISNFD